MKRLALIILSAIMLLSLVSCGSVGSVGEKQATRIDFPEGDPYYALCIFEDDSNTVRLETYGDSNADEAKEIYYITYKIDGNSIEITYPTFMNVVESDRSAANDWLATSYEIGWTTVEMPYANVQVIYCK